MAGLLRACHGISLAPWLSHGSLLRDYLLEISEATPMNFH